LHKGFLQLFLD